MTQIIAQDMIEALKLQRNAAQDSAAAREARCSALERELSERTREVEMLRRQVMQLIALRQPDTETEAGEPCPWCDAEAACKRESEPRLE